MANQPKGVAQTLTDVLTNLQSSLKERTRELDAAKKKLKEEMAARQALEEQIKTGQIDVGGEFVPKAEYDAAVQSQKETQSSLENAQARIESLAKSGGGGGGVSSAELDNEIHKRRKAEDLLSERTENVYNLTRDLQKEIDLRRKLEDRLKILALKSKTGASDSELKDEIEKLEQAQTSLKESTEEIYRATQDLQHETDMRRHLEEQLRDAREQLELAQLSGAVEGTANTEILKELEELKSQQEDVQLERDKMELRLKELEQKHGGEVEKVREKYEAELKDVRFKLEASQKQAAEGAGISEAIQKEVEALRKSEAELRGKLQAAESDYQTRLEAIESSSKVQKEELEQAFSEKEKNLESRAQDLEKECQNLTDKVAITDKELLESEEKVREIQGKLDEAKMESAKEAGAVEVLRSELEELQKAQPPTDTRPRVRHTCRRGRSVRSVARM